MDHGQRGYPIKEVRRRNSPLPSLRTARHEDKHAPCTAPARDRERPASARPGDKRLPRGAPRR
ncbi:hypothetical protein GCM10010156_03680 [Planobispora rosea]|uniref:Uncharacterized protein n=1 Tax=Planobispora rosea TaxID=35762 RepID=A0A8J3RZ40_PLARO|nr:hypothetical protein GCM10010156_03680 [Planobispora rosea]GIH82119.1 hypothetical protein Pro02_05270 [Planobispora rosea]